MFPNTASTPVGCCFVQIYHSTGALSAEGLFNNEGKKEGVVTAVSGNTLSVSSGNKTVQVTYKRKATQTALPTPWLSANIGAQIPAGFAAYENGKVLLESNSVDIWGGSDNFSFMYQKVSGNTTIVAKITALSRVNDWSKAGIMIRESLSPNAAYSMLMKTPRNFVRVQQRASTNAYSTDNPNGIASLHYYNLYNWLKVERNGNVITSYASPDQINWTKFGEQTIAMGTEVYVGLAVCGQTEEMVTASLFENVSVLSQNQKPTVTITSPVTNASFFAPATINIAANASDVDGTVAKVEFFIGSTLIGTDYTAPYNFT